MRSQFFPLGMAISGPRDLHRADSLPFAYCWEGLLGFYPISRTITAKGAVHGVHLRPALPLYCRSCTKCLLSPWGHRPRDFIWSSMRCFLKLFYSSSGAGRMFFPRPVVVGFLTASYGNPRQALVRLAGGSAQSFCASALDRVFSS